MEWYPDLMLDRQFASNWKFSGRYYNYWGYWASFLGLLSHFWSIPQLIWMLHGKVTWRSRLWEGARVVSHALCTVIFNNFFLFFFSFWVLLNNMYLITSSIAISAAEWFSSSAKTSSGLHCSPWFRGMLTLWSLFDAMMFFSAFSCHMNGPEIPNTHVISKCVNWRFIDSFSDWGYCMGVCLFVSLIFGWNKIVPSKTPTKVKGRLEESLERFLDAWELRGDISRSGTKPELK